MDVIQIKKFAEQLSPNIRPNSQEIQNIFKILESASSAGGSSQNSINENIIDAAEMYQTNNINDADIMQLHAHQVIDENTNHAGENPTDEIRRNVQILQLNSNSIIFVYLLFSFF